MANEFNKEERVAFEDLCEAFDDALVLSRNVAKYQTGDQLMERANDIIWRPMPYIAQSFDGMDQTGNFYDSTQLSVPATLGYSKASPWIMDAKELRDALQEGRLGEAAKQKLASDINVAITNVASLQGTLVVIRTGAAAGYADAAQAEALMNEQGVPMYERYLAASPRDKIGLASDLAGRGTMNTKPVSAYERSYIGRIANFESYELDYANRQAAAAGGSDTIDTRTASAGYYTPVATSTASTGETSNVDNRYQQVTVSDTTSVAAGDCFTIAAVNAVHHVTKADTGQLKTFRVISVDSATTMTISPPIISAQGGTDAELQYKNCVVNTEASNSAITYTNVAAASVNPFWQRDALEILPGRYAVPTDAGAAVMRATTDSGIELVWQKQYDINTMKTKYRLDTLFGVVCKQPEMAGIILFGQT